MFDFYRKIISLVRPAEVRFALERCPLCRYPISVQLQNRDIGVRCLVCGASAISRSLVEALQARVDSIEQRDAYELSAAGGVVRYLKAHARSLTTSEYFDGVPSGRFQDGIRCEDVQALSFEDCSFDLCTSTEVFEHVADDLAAFRETRRVLRPGGVLVFTVPLTGQSSTVERTSIIDGFRVNTMPAEYHSDRFRGPNVFCYRNYGDDVLQRLAEAGFVDAQFYLPSQHLFGHSRRVVVAHRGFNQNM